MDREVAEQVLKNLMECSAKLNQSLQLIKDNCREDEFDAYRTAIGHIMGNMYLDVMTAIFREHPELEPDDFK